MKSNEWLGADIDRRAALQVLIASAAVPLLPSLGLAEGAHGTDGETMLYGSLDDMASALRRGDLTAVELLERQLDRIDRLDGALHSYLTVMRESAMADARRADTEFRAGRVRSALQGIPVSVKDLCNTKGVRTTAGLAQRANYVPTTDATVVARLRRAGAVIVGKANLCEGAMSAYSRNYPIPVNPWVADRWPGGSSSGSGVAVAAGLCFGSIGTDTGGSIRWPSCQNGIVGLKPTFGQVSRYSVFGLSHSLDHVGPMARRVVDVAHLFDAIAGPDALDASTKNARSSASAAALRGATSLKGVRVGVDDAYALSGIEPAQIVAVQRVIDVLRDLGATIVPVRLPSMDAVAAQLYPTIQYEVLQEHARLYPSTREQYGEFFREFLDASKQIAPAVYAKAQQDRAAFSAAFRDELRRVDTVLAPGGRVGGRIGPETFYGGFSTLGELTTTYSNSFSPPLRPIDPLAAPMNLAGTPSVCLPAGFDDAGLPTGVQFAGERYTEAMQLRIAHACEQAMPWRDRHPNLLSAPS
ncbi:amidase [Gemmatimonas sp.]|uniref:amidase n=1 Tax=Gemmatimonas sp. TaxID=1962908 RepID=UPI00286B1BB9|nr:amidase [Gemmatimonas sp.]